MLSSDHPDVVNTYNDGLSLREARKGTGRAINTIRKIYDVLKPEKDN
ncbi:hypothetical protein [Vibrio sonorensis]|nr:hypothetical protein [Vibrio sonorensis]